MFMRYMEVLFVVLALLLLTGCGGKELPVSTQSAAEKEEARLEASVETAGGGKPMAGAVFSWRHHLAGGLSVGT